MRGFFNILDHSQNQTNLTTTQNTRMDIIGELEAIIQYENHLMQTNDKSAQKALRDIIEEEKLHVGQLFGLLFQLDKESQVQFEKGLKEFKEEN